MKPLPFFVILSLVMGFISGFYCKTDKGEDKVIAAFHNGQILLPDYAHNDTLVVINEGLLNSAIHNVASDWEINDLLHIGCEDYEGSYQDQFNKLKALQPTWDSLTVATAINED